MNRLILSLALVTSAASALGCGGEPCGADTCSDSEICDQSECGLSEGESQSYCRARPTFCGDEGPPKCGSDGVIYANHCELERAHAEPPRNTCELPPGFAYCGREICDLAKEQCIDESSDCGPGRYYCYPLPEECIATPTCDCMATSCTSCEIDEQGLLYCGSWG